MHDIDIGIPNGQSTPNTNLAIVTNDIISQLEYMTGQARDLVLWRDDQDLICACSSEVVKLFHCFYAQ